MSGLFIELDITTTQDFQKGCHLREIDTGKSRTVAANITAVINEIGQLDCFCPVHGLGKMRPVNGLADCPVTITGFTDIRQIRNQLHDVWTKCLFNIMKGNRGVFHGVMQPCCRNHLRVIRNSVHQFSHCFQMDIIWLVCILSSMVNALVRLSGVMPGLLN